MGRQKTPKDVQRRQENNKILASFGVFWRPNFSLFACGFNPFVALAAGDALTERQRRAPVSCRMSRVERRLGAARRGPPSLPEVEGWLRRAPAAFTGGRAGQP
ncbi:hypothetical protein WME97_34865 [Sorangium sp. So ce367]|uniref:hypothetical protein n=1 Tax=Sorangium sp. So ce367 TaxID=3133305 RepID=UPI003F5F1911